MWLSVQEVVGVNPAHRSRVGDTKERRHLEPPWSSIWGLSGAARSSALNNCISCNLCVIINTLEKLRLTQADCVHLRVRVGYVIISYFPGMNLIAPKLSSMVVQRFACSGIGSLVSPTLCLLYTSPSPRD